MLAELALGGGARLDGPDGGLDQTPEAETSPLRPRLLGRFLSYVPVGASHAGPHQAQWPIRYTSNDHHRLALATSVR
jgi:hypothetical protein